MILIMLLIIYQEKQEEEVVQTSEDGTGDEQTAVTIASVQQASAFADHNIQYQFRTEGGQVTYRVVQVTDQHLEGRDDGGGAVSVVSTAAFTGAPQAVAQAVIQNPFSNGGSPAGEAVGGETRFAYFPATAVSDGTVSVQAATDPTLSQAGGQFYVMMTPPDVIQTGTQRTIAPRTQPYPAITESSRAALDLAAALPLFDAAHSGLRSSQEQRTSFVLQRKWMDRGRREMKGEERNIMKSKGGILSKACDYIRELRQSNQRLQESLKEVERIQVDNELCRQQIEELKNENALLRAQLQQHGIEIVGETATAVKQRQKKKEKKRPGRERVHQNPDTQPNRVEKAAWR
ncbi:Upstream stimulatory factor 2 [Collichthys lucidus]|uniref:Upstream stimulatory factor 2 n=1 Tax=Collichthys lucidus TaxID=240159 RepID=A0A4U5V576_COLLU|nr:Upstream stimulatory factor 2 [Collichthys lucidus]